jgi:hypothetical protein
LTRSTPLLIFATLVHSGCVKSVIPQFEAARDRALAAPPPAPEDWRPDAVMQLSGETLKPVIQQILEQHGTLTETIDLKLGTLTPRLTISDVSLRGTKRCAGCIRVDVDLTGSVRWVTPLASGRQKLDASLSLDAVAQAIDDRGQWQVRLAPRNLRNVDVDLDGKTLSYAKAPIQDWIGQNLLSDIPPQTIATLGDAELPLRAIRVDATGATVQLELLTRSNSLQTLPVQSGTLKEGWQLTIANGTLTHLAAAASFQNGVVGYAIVPEPLAFALDTHHHFTLKLRLWKTSGRGWWRDYEITGTASLQGKGLHLEPTAVEELAQSPGANFVDPLAMIGESVILNTLEKALTTSLPTRHRSDLGGVKSTAKITDIHSSSEAITLSGTLDVSPSKDAKGPPKRSPR